MRFAMTVAAVARERAAGGDGKLRENTVKNVRKVTRFRPGGLEGLEEAVGRWEGVVGREREEVTM
jgi:large subunit ribosomal protein L17